MRGSAVIAFTAFLVVAFGFVLLSAPKTTSNDLASRSVNREANEGSPVPSVAGLRGDDLGVARRGLLRDGGAGSRKEVPRQFSRIRILNCLGEPASNGRAFFAGGDRGTSMAIGAEGSVRVPDGPWTHMVVQLPFHTPACAPLRGESGCISTGVFHFGPPTFYGQIQAPGIPLDDIDLRVDRPWEPRTGWPAVLDEALERPGTSALSIDPETGTAFFCGPPGAPTTLRVAEPYQFDLGGEFAETAVFPAGATQEIVRVSRRSGLLFELRGDPIALGESRFRVHVDLRNEDFTSRRVSLEGVGIGEPTAVPYGPGAITATITVLGQLDPFEFGRALIDLPQLAGPEVVELATDRVVLSVVDERSMALPGVLVVQGTARIGLTDSSGDARVAINPKGGKVSFLKAGFDILSVQPADLAYGDTVALRDATGVLLRFSPGVAQLGLTDAEVIVQGVPVAAPVHETRQLVYESLGVSVGFEETGSWTAFVLPEDSGVPGEGAVSEHVIEGVFDIDESSQVEVVVLDGFGQEAVRTPVTLVAGERAVVEIDTQGCFKQLTGRVLTQAGDPIVTAEVSAGPWSGMPDSPGVDRTGHFSIPVSSKTESITIEAPGFVSYIGEWPPPAAPGGDTVVLSPSRTLLVQVVDEMGARVRVESLVVRSGKSVWAGHQASPGFFEFASVPTSALRAEITVGGKFYTDTVEADLENATVTVAQ